MNVNFNNSRKPAIFRYDSLCKALNEARLKEGGGYVEGFGHLSKGDIVISPDDIQEQMDDLRSLIGTIAMCYEEGNPEMKDMYSEVFPEDKNTRMQCVNQEEEEG